jgi:hypothetical protein
MLEPILKIKLLPLSKLLPADKVQQMAKGSHYLSQASVAHPFFHEYNQGNLKSGSFSLHSFKKDLLLPPCVAVML